jgi:REP element-mobilizing transposase RayT
MIDDFIKTRLYSYMGGIVENHKGTLIEIGGMPDHVHLLVNLPNLDQYSTFLRDIKACSTGWVHRTFPGKADFGWQKGFASITICESVLPNVKKYIQGQEEHHKTVSFEEEYIGFLNKMGVKYDPRFVLD